MAKKKFRTIVIDDVKYAWWVRPDKGYNIFLAQKENINGQMIEVYFKTDISAFWVEFPYTSHLDLRVLMPKDAETIIREALHFGWDPEEKGKPLVYDLINDRLVQRLKVT